MHPWRLMWFIRWSFSNTFMCQWTRRKKKASNMNLVKRDSDLKFKPKSTQKLHLHQVGRRSQKANICQETEASYCFEIKPTSWKFCVVLNGKAASRRDVCTRATTLFLLQTNHSRKPSRVMQVGTLEGGRVTFFLLAFISGRISDKGDWRKVLG